MEYVRLGTTGLKISRIALGCMSYGDPTTTSAHLWSLDDGEAQPFFRQAVELGVTFWDTANVYQHGTSEELVGRASRGTPAARTSSWRPRCTARCTTVPAAKACPARRSSSRSTPRWPGSGPTTSTSTRSTAGRVPYLSPQQLTHTLSPTAAIPTGPYSTWPRRICPLTRLVARSMRHNSSDRSPGTQAASADNVSGPRYAAGIPTGTSATTRLVEGSIRCRPPSLTTHSPPASTTSCRVLAPIGTRATTGDGCPPGSGRPAGPSGRLATT
jgi:hypothetical protein